MLDYLTFNYGAPVERAKLSLSATLRVREKPSTAADSAILGQVENEAELTYWVAPYPGTNYNWYRVIYKGKLGYIADTANLTFTHLTGSNGEGGLSAAQKARLRAIQADLNAFSEEVAASDGADNF